MSKTLFTQASYRGTAKNRYPFVQMIFRRIYDKGSAFAPRILMPVMVVEILGHMSTQNGVCGRLTRAIKTMKEAMILSYPKNAEVKRVGRGGTKIESGLTSNEKRMIKGLKVLSSQSIVYRLSLKRGNGLTGQKQQEQYFTCKCDN